jgi:hypothetical protein
MSPVREKNVQIRVHVAVQKRTQGAQVVGTHRIRPAVLAKHLLDHQGVDVDQADLEQV